MDTRKPAAYPTAPTPISATAGRGTRSQTGTGAAEECNADNNCDGRNKSESANRGIGHEDSISKEELSRRLFGDRGVKQQLPSELGRLQDQRDLESMQAKPCRDAGVRPKRRMDGVEAYKQKEHTRHGNAGQWHPPRTRHDRHVVDLTPPNRQDKREQARIDDEQAGAADDGGCTKPSF